MVPISHANHSLFHISSSLQSSLQNSHAEHELVQLRRHGKPLVLTESGKRAAGQRSASRLSEDVL